MKYRKATFVLAVASTLCATSATASIKDDCKFLKTYGEAEIGKWVDGQSKLLEMANAQAEIPSWEDYINEKVPMPLTDAEWKEYETLKKRFTAIGLAGSELDQFTEWTKNINKASEDTKIARKEWEALSSAKSGKTAPPAVELDRAEQLATIYTAFCKR